MKQFIWCTFFVLAMFIVGDLYAKLQGQALIDSLQHELAKQKEDTIRVNALIDLSARYRNSSLDTSLKYATEAKLLAEKLNYQKGLGYAFKSIGLVYNTKGDYVAALEAWKEAMSIFDESGNRTGVANMLNNIGVIYYDKGDEANALDYYLRSLKVSEEIKDTVRIATALANIGAVYSNKPATYDKAMQFHKKAQLYSIAIGDSSIIANEYSNIGELFVSMQKLDSGILYLKKACDMLPGTSEILFDYITLGRAYRMKKDFAQAIGYYTKAYDAAKGYDAKLDMGQALIGIAETNKEKGDHKTAIKVYKDAEKIFSGIGLGESYDIEKVYTGLVACYSYLKDYDNAFHYQALLIDTKEKIYNLEVDKKMSTKLFAFEMGKKQNEIDLQKAIIGRQKLVRNGFIGGFAVVLLFAVIFFSQRNKIKQGKKQSDELLLNILPHEVAEELKAKGSAEARLIEEVTVLFTDFKGFTQLSEKLSPKELIAEINECFSAFDQIMQQHGVEKIKTIGDSYMAAGGLPIPNRTHPEDVVSAAVAIQNFMQQHKTKKEAAGQLFFEIRIGVHTGSVVAGIVGVKKFQYDIWGDTVNIASRMESSGSVGKVNISEATYELVKDKFTCEYRGEIDAKGKGMMKMYFVS